MKNLFLISLSTISLLGLSACNQNSTSSSSLDFDPHTDSAFLDFIDINTLYVDIHLNNSDINNLELKIGDTKITESGTVTYSTNDEFSSLQFPATLKYAFVFEKGDSNTFYTNVRSTESDHLELMFTEYFSSIMQYERCYMLVANDELLWNHSLSEKLNSFLTEKFLPGSGD